jgi:putative SOS response-associated peptidase YedK
MAGKRDLSLLQKRLEDYDAAAATPVYHTNGFDHADVPVITNQEPDKIAFFSWGLIPYWVRDTKQAVQLSNKTLNAQGEHIFEKPSFREAAKRRRCLILVDGFYEHHHKNGKTFPYHIVHREEEPIALGALWERWENKEEGILRYTVSLVTTAGNPLMAGIHNNPKLKGPRMPLIIPVENEALWLQEEKVNHEDLKSIIQPYNERMLTAYPVRRLRGKEYIGNRKEIIQPFDYPELNSLFDM